MMNIHRVTAWESSQSGPTSLRLSGSPPSFCSMCAYVYVRVRARVCTRKGERERPAPHEGGRERERKRKGGVYLHANCICLSDTELSTGGFQTHVSRDASVGICHVFSSYTLDLWPYSPLPHCHLAPIISCETRDVKSSSCIRSFMCLSQ